MWARFMTGLPQCDVCTPLGFDSHQQAGEMALFMPQFGEWLCAHCRLEKGLGYAQVVVPGRYYVGQRGFIAPGTPEHKVMISPSKVASILNVSRWESAYTLWHRMRGLIADQPPKDEFDVGHDLESYAAARWRRKNPGWRLSAGEVQWVLPPDRLGFPAVCTVDRRASRGRAQRCVELKRALTMSDLEQWGDDLTGDLPEDYAAQVTAQMLFSGLIKYDGHVVAIGPYYQDRVYEVEYRPTVAQWIVTECLQFWQSLRAKTVPPLDNSKSTYETVRELHPDIDGTTVAVDADLGMAVHNANADLSDAKKKLTGLKSQLLDAMGNAQTAVIGEPNDKNALKVATRSPHASGSASLNPRPHPPSHPSRQQEGQCRMTTDVATLDDTTTDIVPGQVGFNSAQKAMLAQLGLSDAPDGDLILFSHVCQKSGLDPFRREIYMIGRNTQVSRYVPNDSGEGQHKETRWETVYTIQTGIQGFRKRARELAEDKGVRLGFNGPYWCGQDGQWTEVWPEKTAPVAAKYIVFRDGEPVPAVCHYDEYVQEVGTGADRKPNSMWSKMPRNQLAKCAEAAALQRAFPDELSGLLLEDAAVHTINEDGEDVQPEQPAKTKRRGGRGVNGLEDRATAKQQTVVDGEVADPGQDGGNDQSQGAEPSSGPQLCADSGDQDEPEKFGDRDAAAKRPQSKLREPLEKRLFKLIGRIEPAPSRDDRLDIYKAILERQDITSTNDLTDVEVTTVGQKLYEWLEAGSLNNKVHQIIMAADAAATEQENQQ
jgi:phage recombination protein Bet